MFTTLFHHLSPNNTWNLRNYISRAILYKIFTFSFLTLTPPSLCPIHLVVLVSAHTKRHLSAQFGLELKGSCIHGGLLGVYLNVSILLHNVLLSFPSFQQVKSHQQISLLVTLNMCLSVNRKNMCFSQSLSCFQQSGWLLFCVVGQHTPCVLCPQVGWSTARDYYTFLWSPMPEKYEPGSTVHRTVVFQGMQTHARTHACTHSLCKLLCSPVVSEVIPPFYSTYKTHRFYLIRVHNHKQWTGTIAPSQPSIFTQLKACKLVLLGLERSDLTHWKHSSR